MIIIFFTYNNRPTRIPADLLMDDPEIKLELTSGRNNNPLLKAVSCYCGAVFPFSFFFVSKKKVRINPNTDKIVAIQKAVL